MLRSLRRAVTAVILLLAAAPASGTVVTLAVPHMWQHKDTTMLCVAPGGNALIHPWNDATANQCSHCSYYCAPASISMYAQYRNRTGNFILMDNIYDNGKFTQGEMMGDGIIQTHGVGMFDAVSPGGIGGPEVQTAFQWAVGVSPVQWGVNYGPPFTANLVIANIDAQIPILWCDHFGYPAGITPPLPEDYVEVNGHAKIIAGYDDSNTPEDFADDLYYILDPWPGGAASYWVPQASVLDLRDLYITYMDVTPSAPTSLGRIKAQYAH